MGVPLQNATIQIIFKIPSSFGGGRPTFTEVSRTTTGFVTNGWKVEDRGGRVPPNWEGVQRMRVTMKDNFIDDAGNVIRIRIDDDMIITMTNQLIVNTRFKVVNILAAPTGKIAPAWFIEIAEASQ